MSRISFRADLWYLWDRNSLQGTDTELWLPKCSVSHRAEATKCVLFTGRWREKTQSREELGSHGSSEPLWWESTSRIEAARGHPPVAAAELARTLKPTGRAASGVSGIPVWHIVAGAAFTAISAQGDKTGSFNISHSHADAEGSVLPFLCAPWVAAVGLRRAIGEQCSELVKLLFGGSHPGPLLCKAGLRKGEAGEAHWALSV